MVMAEANIMLSGAMQGVAGFGTGAQSGVNLFDNIKDLWNGDERFSGIIPSDQDVIQYDGYMLDGLQLTINQEEAIELEGDVTDYTISGNYNVQVHYSRKPLTYTLRGSVTELYYKVDKGQSIYDSATTLLDGATQFTGGLASAIGVALVPYKGAEAKLESGPNLGLASAKGVGVSGNTLAVGVVDVTEVVKTPTVEDPKKTTTYNKQVITIYRNDEVVLTQTIDVTPDSTPKPDPTKASNRLNANPYVTWTPNMAIKASEPTLLSGGKDPAEPNKVAMALNTAAGATSKAIAFVQNVQSIQKSVETTYKSIKNTMALFQDEDEFEPDIDKDFNNQQKAYLFIEALYQYGVPCSIDVSFSPKLLDNMVLIHARVTKSAPTLQLTEFELTFKQITTVSTGLLNDTIDVTNPTRASSNKAPLNKAKNATEEKATCRAIPERDANGKIINGKCVINKKSGTTKATKPASTYQYDPPKIRGYRRDTP